MQVPPVAIHTIPLVDTILAGSLPLTAPRPSAPEPLVETALADLPPLAAPPSATLRVRLVELDSSGAPRLLDWQRNRDQEGGGVSVRPVAEEELTRMWDTPGLTRCRAKTQLLTTIDRCLSDEQRCSAYGSALEEELRRGGQRVVFLGMGSLLPAIRAAQAGAHVCVVEPSTPLTNILRLAAAKNGVSLAVVPKLSMVKHAWGSPPDVLVTESVDEGLLSEGIIQQLKGVPEVFGAAGEIRSWESCMLGIHSLECGF